MLPTFHINDSDTQLDLFTLLQILSFIYLCLILPFFLCFFMQAVGEAEWCSQIIIIAHSKDIHFINFYISLFDVLRTRFLLTHRFVEMYIYLYIAFLRKKRKAVLAFHN